MKIIIIPGIHSVKITDSFLNSLDLDNCLVFPVDRYPPYSFLDIDRWLKRQNIKEKELLFISFSAGVVGAIGSATLLQIQGYKIQGLIAIDGWGVPLWSNFPVYRLSHDYFTHWSSLILGGGKDNFYADPPVNHLDMWDSPESCYGWREVIKNHSFYSERISYSALTYIKEIIMT